MDVGPDRPTTTARGSEIIVAFKGPTVVLFGAEVGNDGERVPSSSFTFPLQVKYFSSNADRVQIETPAGPRWVSRSEVVAAKDVVRPVRR